ncbi:ATP-binding protein [Aquimarina sp. MMG015]|uniref:AAA family ATPase n=1 Tax=Aquimarina TaxID=290174 RepID=UPI0004236E28|nr:MULTISPECIES: ATP-binding protein [Aquimarina]AXT56993.1 nicotinate-nucleotide adenylyltransferase [Aquimarina sp. AD1]MBQ4801762.1 ATP-binding protein [Aquimarina sp. MMG015]RKN36935.1 nicotinate-nucleotide adenylyltransferase [Aquimarina sp. AD1]
MEEKLRQEPSDCIRIVLFGPESTGKTTLSRQLANHYNVSWVPEYMRIYLQDKWNRLKEVCVYEDLIPIATGQMKLENQMIKKDDPIIFCDTNLLEIKVYSEAYYDGLVPEVIEKFSLENTYDLYLLTYIDTPWVPDDLRDKPDQREEMFLNFKESLEENNCNYVTLKGDPDTRFKKAKVIIDQLIKEAK